MSEQTRPRQRRERFTMLRTFAAADVLTLGNGCCGSGAILTLMQYVATGETRWLWLARRTSTCSKPTAVFQTGLLRIR